MDKAQEIIDTLPNIMVVKFSDAEVPEFKEVRNKDWILFGKDNGYPEYLIHLYNKSGKHGAIINGKAKYISGSGFKSRSNKTDFKLPAINRLGETWDDVGKKGALDVEIFGGARLMIIWDIVGRIADILHLEFYKVRRGKDGGFYYKENWKERGDATFYPEFDINDRKGCQIFAYDEYRPGTGLYPLPEYLPCCNYIETDIEISKFHLSAIKNGMMPSKAIEFFQGDPTDEKKREIEKRFSRKFSGAENAGKFVMIFSQNKDKAVNITDLSASELDKQFDILNKTCEQEIFTGHQVVSPMLFGIKTEGQLGGATELDTAYQIFINTYAKPKQAAWERIANYFSAFAKQVADLFIQQLDPIGLVIPDSLIATSITTEEVRERLGLPVIEKPADSASQKTLNALSSVSPLVATKILDNLNRNEIRGLAGLPPVPGGDIIPTADLGQPTGAPLVNDGLSNEEGASAVNDSIKNLTAKQHQQLMRIIRQYSKGQLTKEAASVLLKTGLGLTDNDILTLLGIEEEPVEMRSAFTAEEEDSIIQMFNECGSLKSDYHIVKTKKVKFSTDDEALDDELNFFEQAFKTTSVTISEKSILELISKDKLITPEVIAETLGTTAEYITSKIASLIKRGYLDSSTETIGDDEQIVRELKKPLDDITTDGPTDGTNTTEISIKYSYEGPTDSRNRPFCAKMMELDRLYSRFEIEKISDRLGYSVFDRRGGFWTHKGTDITTPYCRHNWVSNVIVKKGEAS